MLCHCQPYIGLCFSSLFFQETDKLHKVGVCGFGLSHFSSTFTCSSNSFNCLSNIFVASRSILSDGSTPVDSIFSIKAFFSHSTFIPFDSCGQASTQSMQRLHAKRSRTSTLFPFISSTFLGHISTHFVHASQVLLATVILGKYLYAHIETG